MIMPPEFKVWNERNDESKEHPGLRHGDDVVMDVLGEQP
jgi:hypothetical protein